MSELTEELNKRLTFAIISHPDAGKTTITEKLLLFGGAIHMAGAVKSKRNSTKTTSDFMKMEQERGISISTSVMGFDYKGREVRLLDTPGHADFSEDTYRTLTAVDSALMVIDSVKGVEERTKTLCEITAMRATPVITYINKMDREGREPIELLDEIEEELKIKACPLSWPIGQGQQFKGVYSIYENRIILFNPRETLDTSSEVVEITDINDSALDDAIGETLAKRLREELELVCGVYPEFDKDEYLKAKITPVFFGSAINNFGVRELIDSMVDIAPEPLPRATESRIVSPDEDKFTGLIFKIHANLNPRHRDRIAFMRINSGIFERNKAYTHVRSGKTYKAANPTAFMAQDREIIDKAFPGDIIGLHDTGTFKIGDVITEGEKLQFTGIPNFAPSIFRIAQNKDPLKSKQFDQGLQHLTEEGVAQVFYKVSTKERIIGVVGPLQLEVIQYRLDNEYKAKCNFIPVEYIGACWVSSSNKEQLNKFEKFFYSHLAKDKTDKLVYMYSNKWVFERTKEEYPELTFATTSD
ncbi:peptide chain release factor 3 [Spirochaeta cellobiosiphila]|uniref:peptide chain release factor 3 n=1 Tax=Spirochaeta cellobiosiphila TaxID=504483 RepID=UPI0004186CD7|nr:peptide chain release factor 3 [Spirochaeta cellobiosiphila]